MIERRRPGRGNRGYPRPQLVRAGWRSLDGIWEFHIDPDGRLLRPSDVPWSRSILVPFSPETSASGIGDTGFYRACWYRRSFDAPALEPHERLLLHFGAVDHRARVWVNGAYAGDHVGGYTPFELDITDLLSGGEGAQTVVVHAEDDPGDLSKPRGKQDWQLEPHSIWYPRTTGVWQSVWLEKAPATRIGRLLWRASLLRWEIGFEAWLAGPWRDDLRLHLRLEHDGKPLVDDSYGVIASEVHRRIALSDPGIDDFRNELLWSPEQPRLIDAIVRLTDPDGRVVDEVTSYTALRSFGLDGDHLSLNGRPYQLRMVLDQGYWPDTGMTPPDDAALQRDVELVRAMGFNGVRKHQKVEDPRFLYWADRLGLLVWSEMPSAYRFTPDAVERVTREWTDVIRRDASHPCIVAWVPVNESWGVPNLPESPAERHYVQALYSLSKTLDPTRPVVGNDGWESVVTDIIAIHDYEAIPERLAHRYHGDALLPHILRKERPGGRALVVGDHPHHPRPLVLSEFGGIALREPGVWGYSVVSTPDELARRYEDLMRAVHSIGMLAGFCYTQLADTYQEANGLLHADRTPKFPIEQIRAATMGSRRR